jgi:carbon monoxide dehydrogenase subunit G
MDLKGSYKLRAPRQKVFASMLDPAILKASIPGCEAVWYPDAPETRRMKVRLASPIPLPGLQGPYDVTVVIQELREPDEAVLQAGRTGRIGGTVNTTARLILADDDGGTLLTYDAHAEMQGPIAFVDNPIFQEVIKHSLMTFLKNLNAAIAP